MIFTKGAGILEKKQALGLRIKEFRERQKMTQDKLAEMVGIDPKHLSRIENGRNYPSIETLEKIVNSLNVTFEDIFNFNHFEEKTQLIENIRCALEKLPQNKLNFIFKMIKEL